MFLYIIIFFLHFSFFCADLMILIFFVAGASFTEHLLLGRAECRFGINFCLFFAIITFIEGFGIKFSRCSLAWSGLHAGGKLNFRRWWCRLISLLLHRFLVLWIVALILHRFWIWILVSIIRYLRIWIHFRNFRFWLRWLHHENRPALLNFWGAFILIQW